MTDGKDIIWLASYPRSGNTFLRTILWHCFGLQSGSVYPDDLGGKRELEEYVGHIEHGPDHRIPFPEGGLQLVKTHETPTDGRPAIYVIRDGRAACVSLWKFYKREIPLRQIVEGRLIFGTWGAHVCAWNPWERPNTLLLKYEDMENDLAGTLDRISAFLHRPVVGKTVPDRGAIAGADGRWVRTKSDWRKELSGSLLNRFYRMNKAVLEKAKYI